MSPCSLGPWLLKRWTKQWPQTSTVTISPLHTVQFLNNLENVYPWFEVTWFEVNFWVTSEIHLSIDHQIRTYSTLNVILWEQMSWTNLISEPEQQFWLCVYWLEQTEKDYKIRLNRPPGNSFALIWTGIVDKRHHFRSCHSEGLCN